MLMLPGLLWRLIHGESERRTDENSIRLRRENRMTGMVKGPSCVFNGQIATPHVKTVDFTRRRGPFLWYHDRE